MWIRWIRIRIRNTACLCIFLHPWLLTDGDCNVEELSNVQSNFDHKRCLFFFCALYFTGSVPYRTYFSVRYVDDFGILTPILIYF
jgi:hypothetical protein